MAKEHRTAGYEPLTQHDESLDEPRYSIAIHGPRSEEHLLQVLEERRATKHLRVEVTPEFWEEKKRALAEKHGLRYL